MGRDEGWGRMVHDYKEREKMEKKFTVSVYIDSGVVFYYEVGNSDSAREHSAAIVRDGYRHNPTPHLGDDPLFEHYGPHRILKVKVTGAPIPTKYHDKSRGT